MWAKLTEGFLYRLKGVTMILLTGHETRNGEKRLKIWICLLEWFLEDPYSKREGRDDMSSHQRFVKVCSLLRGIILPPTSSSSGRF